DARGNPGAPGRIAVERSLDGLTWEQDTTLATSTTTRTIDKPMIAVDQNPLSPHHGRVVVTWTDIGQSGANLLDKYSDDGGTSWVAGNRAINNPLDQCANGTSP